MRYLFVVAFFFLLLAGSFLSWQGKLQEPTTSNIPNIPTVGDNSLVLLFVGDIMLDRGVEYYIRKNQDWKWPFLKIADILQQADLVFANLESVVSDKGINQGSIYSFRADPQAMEGLVFAGIDVVSVANNHSFDYGSEAFADSLERLKIAGIDPAGGSMSQEGAQTAVLKTVNNTIIGILAYTSVDSPSKIPQLQQDIEIATQQADIIIVSFHWGIEYQKEPTATQKLLSKTAIDAGANLVVGHHPHVVQPVEHACNQVTHLCGGWIAYSLGNFVFDQGFSPETMEGLLLEVKVQEKQITQVTPRVIKINSSFQPTLE